MSKPGGALPARYTHCCICACKTNSRPEVVRNAYKNFKVKQVEKARNHKPQLFVANASIIQAAMIKTTDPAIAEIPTAPHTDRPHEAKRQGVKTPVLVYDRATLHTSKETQGELGRVFEKGNYEAQSPKSPDTNNGDAGLFPNGARATAYSCATNKAEVEMTVMAWWKTVDVKMLTAIDDRVLRNYGRI
jgi:hypothetical protein